MINTIDKQEALESIIEENLFTAPFMVELVGEEPEYDFDHDTRPDTDDARNRVMKAQILLEVKADQEAISKIEKDYNTYFNNLKAWAKPFEAEYYVDSILTTDNSITFVFDVPAQEDFWEPGKYLGNQDEDELAANGKEIYTQDTVKVSNKKHPFYDYEGKVLSFLGEGKGKHAEVLLSNGDTEIIKVSDLKDIDSYVLSLDKENLKELTETKLSAYCMDNATDKKNAMKAIDKADGISTVTKEKAKDILVFNESWCLDDSTDQKRFYSKVFGQKNSLHTNKYITGLNLSEYSTDAPDGVLMGFDSDAGEMVSYKGKLISKSDLPGNITIRKINDKGDLEEVKSKEVVIKSKGFVITSKDQPNELFIGQDRTRITWVENWRKPKIFSTEKEANDFNDKIDMNGKVVPYQKIKAANGKEINNDYDKLAKSNVWDLFPEDIRTIEEEGSFESGHWVLSKINGEYEAVRDGLYMEVFKTLEDLVARKNKISDYEYSEEKSEENGEETFVDSKGNEREYKAADGKEIYEGKTKEQVWNNWTVDQRIHFIKDHDKNNLYNAEEEALLDYDDIHDTALSDWIGEHMFMGSYGDGGPINESDLSTLKKGFSIKWFREYLNKNFRDSFGFTVNKPKKGTQAEQLIADDEFRGIKDDSLILTFPSNRGMCFNTYQGSENTYFNFVLYDKDSNGYVGGFGFKDDGDVDPEYITRFVALLMQAYGYPFTVKHTVAANGSIIRADKSSLLKYVNFEDNWHINLLKLNPNRNQNGLKYKNNNKYAVSRTSDKGKRKVYEFETLQKAENKFNDLVAESKTFSNVIKEGVTANYNDVSSKDNFHLYAIEQNNHIYTGTSYHSIISNQSPNFFNRDEMTKGYVDKNGDFFDSETDDMYKDGGAITSYSPEALKFIGKVQLSITKTNPEFEDARVTLNKLVSEMPKTYETDGIKTNDKIAYLHYFKNSTDVYIVEKDMESEQRQAFGYSILNGDTQNAELGYIDIDEIKDVLELDLYWTPTKIGAIKSNGKAADGAEISSYKKQLTEALEKKYNVNISDTGFDDTHIKLAMDKNESIDDVVSFIGNTYKLTAINQPSSSSSGKKSYICVIKDKAGNELGSYPVTHTDDKYLDDFLKAIGVKMRASDTRKIEEVEEIEED